MPGISEIRIDMKHDKIEIERIPEHSASPLEVIAGAPDRPLTIGEVEIPCYVLEGETRVLSQSGMFSGLGLARRGLVPVEGGAQIPRFAASKAIKPFVSGELMHGLTNPILFTVSGTEAYGFPATILPKICKAVLDARRAGSLNHQQRRLAQRCEILIQGLATVGIVALVDEATGYERIREERSLAAILERFIAEELQPWTRTFPFEFYEEIFRLHGWPGPEGVKRPGVIGHYTNNIVYERLAPGVLDELRKLNPTQPSGNRRNRHHQWFTPDIGHPKLKEHLAAVIALMRASDDWPSFQYSLQRAFPTLNSQLPLAIERNNRGRPLEKTMPPRVDASPEEIARAVMSVPNKRKDEWRYLNERKRQIRDKD